MIRYIIAGVSILALTLVAVSIVLLGCSSTAERVQKPNPVSCQDLGKECRL